MTLEFEVGATFTLNGRIHAVCEEVTIDKCPNCVLVNSKLCSNILCFPKERTDGKDVRFRKLEEGGKA